MNQNTKPTLEICLTPDAVSFVDLTGKIAVVVDIFRATSCMVAGLACGVTHVVPVADIADALHYKSLKDEDYVTAGERNGEKVEGFDIGNSPFEHMAQEFKKIVMTTTNGTQAIEAVKSTAEQVVIGSFLNLRAITNYLKTQNKDVVIVCAGWKGRFNAEDSLFAGALALKLKGDFWWEGDETLFASHSYSSVKNNLPKMLKYSSHYKRLKEHGVENDMDFCLEIDKFKNVPILKENFLVNS
ncbi:2-phosphosulfolactate phosphatase [Bernardetia sp. OM2101]|uniref:2-phosphosulfolactate phosphatase n=1 Tax=Bernardetia sp. OM2101 TaxID=3344876 RepID=UPI0035CFC6C8